MDIEVLVLLGELVQLLRQKDVLWVDVGEDKVEFGGILPTVPGSALDNSLDNLEHGRDAGAAGNHTNVTGHVGSIDHGTLGTTDLHGVANPEAREVFRDVALRIGFYEEIKVTGFVVGRDRGVGSDDLLGLALDGGRERDMLANWKTKRVGGAWKGEAVYSNIVGDDGLFFEEEFLELLGLEHLSRFCNELSASCLRLLFSGRKTYGC